MRRANRSRKDGNRASMSSSRLATPPISNHQDPVDNLQNGMCITAITPEPESNVYQGGSLTDDSSWRAIADESNHITAARALRQLADHVQPPDEGHQGDQNDHQSRQYVADDLAQSTTSGPSPHERGSGKERPTESTRLWERLLDTDPTLRTSIRDAGQMAYLGESFPVSYFLQNYASNSAADGAALKRKADDPTPRLHFQVEPPSTSTDRAMNTPAVKAPDGHVLPGGQYQLEYLYRNGCFEAPPMEVQKWLFEAFFEYFYP